jgi:secondary thiamine-phosphate synthase enzyme
VSLKFINKVKVLKQFIEKIKFCTKNEEFLDITSEVKGYVHNSSIKNGILNLSILHTSCSLMIQENADSTVILDIKSFLNKIAPKENNYLHDTEGPDDMPAHIKSMITQSNLTLSINNKSLVLGVWQGIFLLEHRLGKKKREILLHILGE